MKRTEHSFCMMSIVALFKILLKFGNFSLSFMNYDAENWNVMPEVMVSQLLFLDKVKNFLKNFLYLSAFRSANSGHFFPRVTRLGSECTFWSCPTVEEIPMKRELQKMTAEKDCQGISWIQYSILTIHTDSIKINRPGHKIRIYWTYFRKKPYRSL